MTRDMVITQGSSVGEIRQLHSEILTATRTVLDKAIRIGELLTQERATLKHGDWLPWVKSNLPFSDRTARNYMRCFDQRERLKLENVSNLTGAYLMLGERTLSASAQPQNGRDVTKQVRGVVESALADGSKEQLQALRAVLRSSVNELLRHEFAAGYQELLNAFPEADWPIIRNWMRKELGKEKETI